jgi:hypothetical protein
LAEAAQSPLLRNRDSERARVTNYPRETHDYLLVVTLS